MGNPDERSAARMMKPIGSKLLRRWLPGMLALALAPSAARAQMEGAFDMGVLGMNGAIDHVTRSEAARAKGKQPAPPPSQAIARSLASQVNGHSNTASAPVPSASYRANADVRVRIAGIMADAAEQRTPGTAQEMRELVTSGKALREYERIAPAIGLHTNDAIDALAFYLLAQWGVANDHRNDITRAQVAGVRRQAANAYAAIADQLGAGELHQQFAEVLIVQGIIMSGVHEAAVMGNDAAAAQRYAAMARRGGQALFTMDPTEIALTDNGFRRK